MPYGSSFAHWSSRKDIVLIRPSSRWSEKFRVWSSAQTFHCLTSAHKTNIFLSIVLPTILLEDPKRGCASDLVMQAIQHCWAPVVSWGHFHTSIKVQVSKFKWMQYNNDSAIQEWCEARCEFTEGRLGSKRKRGLMEAVGDPSSSWRDNQRQST